MSLSSGAADVSYDMLYVITMVGAAIEHNESSLGGLL